MVKCIVLVVKLFKSCQDSLMRLENFQQSVTLRRTVGNKKHTIRDVSHPGGSESSVKETLVTGVWHKRRESGAAVVGAGAHSGPHDSKSEGPLLKLNDELSLSHVVQSHKQTHKG